MANISHFTQTVNGVSTTYDIHDANAIPREGGAVMTGSVLSRNVINGAFRIDGGTDYNNGGSLILCGSQFPDRPGVGWLHISVGPANYKDMILYPNGTFTWSGQPIQYISDQRLKQQITEIDDKLLDAWEDVELSQFKYNDAVDQKKDKARLHTGYVVQQIDSACKSHNVDVSQYGLYCHEEYPEETEEVEVEHEDGTKVKEKKVIREASEHYSLRYTEVYAVECMYLRRENSRLKEKLANLEERLEKLEKAENSENQEK